MIALSLIIKHRDINYRNRVFKQKVFLKRTYVQLLNEIQVYCIVLSKVSLKPVSYSSIRAIFILLSIIKYYYFDVRYCFYQAV